MHKILYNLLAENWSRSQSYMQPTTFVLVVPATEGYAKAKACGKRTSLNPYSSMKSEKFVLEFHCIYIHFAEFLLVMQLLHYQSA